MSQKKLEGYSILVSVYGNEDYIEECLDSIQNQTYFKKNENYEILVGVDGCTTSLEKLKEISSKYKNITVIFMSENKGVYVTINTLISISKYDKLLKFDSDDIMFDNLIDVVNKNIKHSDILRFGFLEFLNDLTNSKLYKHPPADGVFCFKEYILKDLGGFKDWKCAADTDFRFRLKKTHTVNSYPGQLFYRRVHAKSLTNDNNTNFNSTLRRNYAKKLIMKHEYIKPIINDYIIIYKYDDKII